MPRNDTTQTHVRQLATYARESGEHARKIGRRREAQRFEYLASMLADLAEHEGWDATPRPPAAAEAPHPDSARLDAIERGGWCVLRDNPEMHGGHRRPRWGVETAAAAFRSDTLREAIDAAMGSAPHPAGPRGDATPTTPET